MSIQQAANATGGTKEHEGGGARSCMHGYLCQLHLCTLNFLRAYRSGYEFELASEVKNIKDFDDMILKYKNEKGRDIGLYLQSKHFQSCDDKVLTERLLLDGVNEIKLKEERFLLSKYYESYLKNGIGSKEDYFIVYTNLGLDIENLSKAGIDVVLQLPENTSRFFQINSEGKSGFYKLSVDENHHLYEKLYKLSDAYKVAYELVEKIKSQERNSGTKLEIKNDVLKKYKDFLGLRVLIRNKDVEINNERQFSDEFISCETKSPTFKVFRNIFKKLYFEAIKPNYEFTSEEDFQDDLRKKRIIVSNKFRELDGNNMIEFPDPSGCVKRFFEQFVLAVKQPNVAELEKIIKKEIEEIFCLKGTDLIVPVIKSTMLDWMKEKTGKWLNRDDAESKIREIKQNMETLMTRGISVEYQSELKRTNCIIQCKELEKDSTVKAIRDFLHDECEIMLIRSNQSLLSLIKVHQGINWMIERYGLKCLEKYDDLLFLPFGSLASSESVRNDLKNKNSFNLLVSIVQEAALKEGCHECLKDLLDSFVSKKRKAILVFEEVVSNSIESIIKDMRCEERVFNRTEIILDSSLSFLQLDEDAQNQLLQMKVVNFQGKLTNLLLFSSQIKNIIDEEILLSLVQKAPINIGKIKQEIGFTDSYVPRLLSFDGSPSETSNEPTTSTLISEDDLLSNEFGKVLIISGEPNAGKSYLLSSLSKKLKMKYPAMWVLQIDLNDYAFIFNKMALYTTLTEQYSYAEDTGKTVKFMIETVLGGPLSTKITSGFEKQLLRLGFRGEIQLVLLLDGFSDLCKDGSRFAKQLLMGMQKTKVEMLIITTRPENNCVLECLEGKYFSLGSFANNNDLNLVRLTSAIKLPENLDDIYRSKFRKLEKFLSKYCMPNGIEGYRNDRLGKGGEELWREIQNRFVSGVERSLAREIFRATDGNYGSASSAQIIINAISYIFKKRLDVTTRLE
ncbi:uncharacterized protein [Halyomorpha halys]|uniref:uncharacterized protein n=1 Tax=Halyomorpha halys TaxID=286706 RepID=UPI0006D4E13D|nr:uncharacterized protein LOC106689795 [Halyomorpha halys]